MNLTQQELEALAYAANRVLVSDQQWVLRRVASGRAPLEPAPSDALTTARDKVTAELQHQQQGCAECLGRGWSHLFSVERCQACKRYESDEDAKEAHDQDCNCKRGPVPSCCGRPMRRRETGESWHCAECGGIHLCSDPRLRAGASCPTCRTSA